MTKIERIKQMLEERVLLFSDLHIGNKMNSSAFHKTALGYVEWLKQTANDNHINTLVFLGDFFHYREELNLTAVFTANKFLETLKDFQIIILVGNHDCYYKDNARIHSTQIFEKWDNIVVVDETTSFEYMDKTIAFLPWGFDYSEIPSKVDYAFGHLEIETFRVNKVKICEKNHHSINSASLLKKIDKVITGHFHVRSEKKYKSGIIKYIGNTYEQNWSDYQEEKGVEILNFSTGEMEFIKNDVSPKHIKVSLSKILAKDEDEIAILKNDFKGNITKLIVDEEVDIEKVYAISDRLSKLKPLDFNAEIITSSSNKTADDFESVEIDMDLLLTEYVEKLEIEDNKDKILSETLSLYEEALLEVNTNDE